MRRANDADELIEIRGLVRAKGLRCTSARMAVMRTLRCLTSPVTHAELAADLVPQGFDKATVYRNLIDLTEAGLVSRTELGDHVWRFELRGQQRHGGDEHSHFVCTECGSVTCLSDVELNSATRKQTAKIGRVTEVLLKGHCKDCD